MSSFMSALMKERKKAKKEKPDTGARFKEIKAVLKKYNYDNGITPEITVGILEDLGPTFVKLGQIASQQTEYIPPEYCEALSKLRSEVAPMEIETVRSQIEKYLGKPVNELFASFDEKPLGSASIAQVHKAELFDGTVVAVKVRRPGIVDTVARDFALIEKILDKFIKGDSNIKNLIVELEHTSKLELDLTNEAANLDRFYENNAGREKVSSPKCYRNLTCEAVLTEGFVTGKEVSDTAFLESLGEEERERIAALIADNFASQVLTDGFYHADPHSGNVLIKAPGKYAQAAEAAPSANAENVKDRVNSADAGTGKDQINTSNTANAENSGDDAQRIPLPEHSIEWIDFGMMGLLSRKQRQTLIDIVTNVVMQDAYGLKRTVLQVAQPKGEINQGNVLEMCEGICGQYIGADFGDFDLGDLLGTVLGGLEDENFKVDPFLTNLARGIIAVEGTIKTLSPKVNILNYFTDKVDAGMDLNLDLEHPENMNPDIAVKLVKLFKGLTDASTKTAESLDMLEKGQIKVRTDFGFEEKALDSVRSLTAFAVRGLLIIALFIGSCLLCHASAFTGEGAVITIVFRVMGFIGYAISIFFVWRLYRNLKNGKKKGK